MKEAKQATRAKLAQFGVGRRPRSSAFSPGD